MKRPYDYEDNDSDWDQEEFELPEEALWEDSDPFEPDDLEDEED